VRQSIHQLITIARLTALEASRQPIFLLLTTSVIVFIGLMPVLITHVIGDAARMVRDSALALQLVSGLILACYAASATITRELRQGTLASIVSKPIPRELFLLAKFAGVAFIMAAYALTTTLATMLSVRTASIAFVYDWWGIGPLLAAVLLAYVWSALQNFITRVPFVSRAYLTLTIAVIAAFLVSCLIPPEFGEEAFGAALPWNIIPAGILLAMAMMLFSALAVALATRLDMLPTVSLCLGLLLAGMMSDYLLGARANDGILFALLYALLPNWQHYWAIDALHNGSIPLNYVGSAAIYTIVYGSAVLAAGLLSFRTMEVK
jgi:ABC-type transport system involved in multi-copper enzyme maturation permease subunit